MKVKITNYNSSINHTTTLKTLEPWELGALLKVRTSTNQARQIEERNAEALKAFNKLCKGSTESVIRLQFGCPHCRNMHCLEGKSCNWDDYPTQYNGLPCTEASFGGVAHRNLLSVSLSPRSIIVHNFSCEKPSLTRAFLKGHIEWSRIVQELGGVRGKKWTVTKL